VSADPVVACVVPALDAAGTVGRIVRGLRAALPHALVVGVDDGSTDGTRAVLAAACDRVVAFDENRGKGAALRAGFDAARALGAEAVLTIDADGQHDPAFAPRILGALSRADLVIGTRDRRRTGMPVHRRVSNALSSAAISRCAGCPLPDSQSGYRAIRRELLDLVHAVGDRYEFETDFLIRAARAGWRIAGVPIPTIYGAPSHFREVRDAMRVIGTIWRHTPWRLTRAGL
jgi:glycosyltransferase involved in cell wall biosynthesis